MNIGELLPCPFCTGRGKLDRVTAVNGDTRFFVRCISCACEGPWTKNEHGALQFWNMRDGKRRESTENGPPDNCAKCGGDLRQLSQVVEDSTPRGVWRYCSQRCQETH